MKPTSIGVIGLGYVGLPLTVNLAIHPEHRVVGVDTDFSRIMELRDGVDRTGMVKSSWLTGIEFTKDTPTGLDLYIICVPTPDIDGKPDYRFVLAAFDTAAP
jgi:UDP-N-acetyl-D-galactosamine dehydrogenase